MASEQVRTVLDHTRGYHQRVAELLAEKSAQSKLPRVSMLLNYLNSHHRKMADAIDQIEADTESKVLDTWVQSSEDSAHLAHAAADCEAPADDAAFDDVLGWSLGLDENALRVYEDLALRGEPVWLRDMFERLHDMARQEEKHVAVQSMRGMDL